MTTELLQRIAKCAPPEMGAEFYKGIEKYARMERDRRMEFSLENGHNVISSDTNLKARDQARWELLAYKYGVLCVCLDFTDPQSPYYTSVDECLKRDAVRADSVGKDVILRMFYECLEGNPPLQPPTHDEQGRKLAPAIIVDLDGTLCHMSGRGPFEEKYDTDIQDPAVRAVIDAFLLKKYNILLVSGREGSYAAQKQTRSWLQAHSVPYENLFMRNQEDRRPDTVVKKEIYEHYIKGKYDVCLVLDDRPCVVRMWRALGLKVLDCGMGYEF